MMSQFPKAQEVDYVERQGGKPKVEKEGDLTIVTHDYDRGEGMIVRSHIDHGTVLLKTNRGIREFLVDLLLEFHGKPCETQSNIVGGEGYDRLRKV